MQSAVSVPFRARETSADSGLRTVMGLLATTFAVWLAGVLGITFTRSGEFFSPFWPLAGVSVACLLLGGVRMAPGIYVGAAIHNTVWNLTFPISWFGPLGTVFEALMIYGLLVRALGPRPRLSNMPGCFAFLLAPWAPAALTGVYQLFLIRSQTVACHAGFTHEWSTLVMANAMGAVLFAPAAAVWTSAPDGRWWRRMAIVAPLTLVTAWLVLADPAQLPPYVLFVPLTASAVLLGLRGTAPLVAALSFAGALAVRHGTLAFASFEALYVFLGAASLCSLVAAAAVSQLQSRLRRVQTSGASADLALWSWNNADGLHFDRLCGDGDTPDPADPRTLFDADTDQGIKQMRIGGREALSFWTVQSRDNADNATEVTGILIDITGRMSLEEARRQAWQAETELRNLRGSLTPHLLFNCLAAVRGILRTEPEKARNFIDHLARFLRDVTDAQARSTLPLLDEWQLCDDFLALQALRYERELPRLVDIGGSAYHAHIPPMILLNLVENAVKHGEVGQSHPLVISAQVHDGILEVKVRNHGVLGPAPAGRPGGLCFALERLRTLYGAAATLDIAQDGDGVVTSLRIPAAAQQPARA